MVTVPQATPPLEHLVILSGLSGAGKKTALHALEDQGFQCIENLPGRLFAQLLEGPAGSPALAVVMDIRDPWFVDHGAALLASAREKARRCRLLFLEADTEELVRRYSETRRRHPVKAASVVDAVAREVTALAGVRALADQVLDTTHLNPHQLSRQVAGMFARLGRPGHDLEITVCSFGFKNGIPTGVDMLLDVRFLPNPYFDPALRPLSGLARPVAAFVLETAQAGRFLEYLMPLLTFLLPQYADEGKTYFSLAIGCTGGQHRSVAIAEKIAAELEKRGQPVAIFHRDLGLDQRPGRRPVTVAG